MDSVRFCPELALALEIPVHTNSLTKDHPVKGPSWPAAKFGVAGHLPILADWHACKIDRVCLNRIEHSVRRRFDSSEVTVWTKRPVPTDRWFSAPTLKELLRDPDVRWFTKPVNLDNLFFVVKSAELEFVLEIAQQGVIAYGDVNVDKLEHLVTELEQILSATRSRFASRAVPSRAIGTVGGAVVGLIGVVLTGWGVTDRSWVSMLLMAGILVTCVVSGWFLIDRLRHRSKVQLCSSESVPKGGWRRWDASTKIALVSLVVSSISTIVLGINVYLTHSKAEPRSMPASSLVKVVMPDDE